MPGIPGDDDEQPARRSARNESACVSFESRFEDPLTNREG